MNMYEGSIPLEDKIWKMYDSLVVADEYHFIFHTILDIIDMNEVDKIKQNMSKEYIGYLLLKYLKWLKCDMINHLLKLSNF